MAIVEELSSGMAARGWRSGTPSSWTPAVEELGDIWLGRGAVRQPEDGHPIGSTGGKKTINPGP
jgi:hypothetical protein